MDKGTQASRSAVGEEAKEDGKRAAAPVIPPLPVRFCTADRRGGGRLLNLSRTELFVSADIPPEIGEWVGVALAHQGQDIEVEGTVRWRGMQRQPFCFGMRIEPASDAYLEFFEELRNALGGAEVPRPIPSRHADG